MNLLDRKEIDKLDARLLEALKKEYGDHEELWIRLDEANINYWDEISTTLTFVFGNDAEDPEVRWEKKAVIYLIDFDEDFIAGQFVQYLIDHDM